MYMIFLMLAGHSMLSAQYGSADWERYEFKNYRVTFSVPKDWSVTINDSTEKSYIECYSRDQQTYFFLTTAENEKKSEIGIVLSYLKVTYKDAQFESDEYQKINNIEFVFCNGVSYMNEIQTYMRLGVGKYKDYIFMIDSGTNNLENNDARELLIKIIQSIKGIH